MRVIGNPGDQALAINNRGQVTGISNVALGPTHGFLYFRGKRTDLCAPPALCGTGYAINDAGHIAGGAAASDNGAALWNGANWRDLGVPPGENDALALGINVFDEVVGISFNNTTNHAFLWNGAFTILPCLAGVGCEATAINNAGTIVGFANVTAPVVWLQGRVYDLNTLIDPHDPLYGQVRLTSASAVNNRGQIAANGCYITGPKVGLCYGFILDPTHDKDRVADQR
jgi:probable HAF family extracellular repeat protein